MKLAVLLLLAVSLWGGQSLTAQADAAIPQMNTAASYRVEFCTQDFTTGGSAHRAVRLNAAGFDSFFTGDTFQVSNASVNGAAGFNVNIVAYVGDKLCIRYQMDLPNLQVSLEIWDQTGARVESRTASFTSVNSANWTSGMTTRGGSQAGAIAFTRVHSTIVPLNSTPPTTFNDTDRLYEWKWDGNLTASFGGVNATGSGSYVATTFEGPISVIKVNSTEWSDWTPIRAGTAATLTGSNSYSQADASNTVTCFWQITNRPSGAPMPTLSSHTACDPTISGTVFGQYTAQMTVTDVSGATSSTTFDFGSVAMDSNGVVVYQDSSLQNILGPMIALGRNPWGYADDTNLRALNVRDTHYDGISPPSWTTDEDGTVNYVAKVNTAKGTLAVAVSSTTQTTIELNPGHTISLTDFPTYISIGAYPGNGSASEQICIASAVGNVLTVCTEGRGWANTTATTASVGGSVWQNKATGTGTSFLSVFCPAGQGVEGQIFYSTGTVAATAGSTTLTGTGTTWNTGNGVVPGRWVRFMGVSGGQPFVWSTPIASVGGTGTITMARAYPATATGVSGVTYAVIGVQARYFTAEWDRPDATVGRTQYAGVGTCGSDTSYYFVGGLEVYEGTQTGKKYSYVDNPWMTASATGTPNFYDEVLANYALWLRSGSEKARLAARKLGDYWMDQPAMDEGWAGSFPRNMSIGGVILAAVTDGRTGNWYGLRKLADKGVTAAADTDCSDDTRENAYQLMWLAFAANYDPVDTGNPAEPNQRSYWKAKLADAYTRDNACKRSDYSFANGYLWGTTTAMSVTNGSKVVTGTGFTSAACNWTAGGNGTIVSGAGSFTVTSGTLVAGGKVLITGTRSGQPYNVYFQFSGTSGTVLLSGTWLGDTGSITWQTESDNNWTLWHIGSPITEGDQGELYGCRFVSSTELELNRNWNQATSSNVQRFRNNLTGWGQQPFIMGIKAWQLSVSAAGATGSTATNYLALAGNTAGWLQSTGYDPVTGGLYYGRIYQQCDPVVGQGDFTGATQRQSECNYTESNKGAARILNAEAQNAIRLWYEANPSAPNITFGDSYYATLWGSQYVAPGYTTDTGGNAFAATSVLNQGKWYGFQFGVGMAHQWPAVRVGGVAPESLVSVPVSARLADVSGAGSIKITATRPNSTTSTAVCTTGACTVQVDSRQGPQWLLTIEYYSNADGTGTRLASGTQVSSGS